MIAEPITMNRIAVRGTGTDVAIVTYGNGVFLPEPAAEVPTPTMEEAPAPAATTSSMAAAPPEPASSGGCSLSGAGL